VKKKPRLNSYFDSDHPSLDQGADELMNVVEYHFSKRPRRLRNLRFAYAQLCKRLYDALRERFK
jgi:hypothetical protein